MWFCKAHATPLSTSDDHGNSLSRKAHGPHGSVEGRLRVNMAVLIGCQVSADWHARLRLTARIVTTSRDGTVTKHSCQLLAQNTHPHTSPEKGRKALLERLS